MPDQNKYSRWVFTIMPLDRVKPEDVLTLPSSLEMKEALETMSDKFVFQLESCPTTGRLHYQGCLETRIRKRQRTVLVDLSVQLDIEIRCITVDRMMGTWSQAEEYCSKDETKKSSTVKSDLLMEEEQNKYKGRDLSIFKEEGFYPWQEDINRIIFETGTFNIKESSSREVFWVEDAKGNSGKSLFTKFLCYNNPSITKLAFGSGSQMRSSIVEEGAKKCYVIDIPRKLCNDDFQNNIYSVIEDLKNGFVKSSMYGKPKTLFMEPPIVIIFSNQECPQEKLSLDRWNILTIINNKLVDLYDERVLD